MNSSTALSTVKATGSDLSIYVLFAIEVLIAFTAPGILFFYVWANLFPEMSILPTGNALPDQFKNAAAFLALTSAGVLLGSIGDFVIQGLDRIFKFGEKIDKAIADSYVATQVGAYDVGEHVKNIAPELAASLATKEQQERYWDNLFKSFKDFAAKDFQRKLNIGLSIVPLIVGNSDHAHQRNLRSYISAPESLFSFFRAVLPIAILVWLRLALIDLNLSRFIYTTLWALPIVLLWIRATIRSYAHYRNCQLHMWVGIGQLNSPTKK